MPIRLQLIQRYDEPHRAYHGMAHIEALLAGEMLAQAGANLAAPPAAYERYARQIAQEYNWVPEAAYRQGRAKVLQAFVDRHQIYFTPTLRALWEDQARANLRRELASLKPDGA